MNWEPQACRVLEIYPAEQRAEFRKRCEAAASESSHPAVTEKTAKLIEMTYPPAVSRSQAKRLAIQGPTSEQRPKISELYTEWCKQQKIHPNRYAPDVHDLIAKAFKAGYIQATMVAAYAPHDTPEPQQRPE